MRTVRVELTTEDIRDGRIRDCFECPLSRAIDRAIGDRVGTGAGRVYLTSQACVNADVAELPPEARAFQAAFDGGAGPFQPFAFDLEIPESWPCRT